MARNRKKRAPAMKAAPGMWGNPVDHPGGEGKGRDEKLPRFFLGGLK